jgi:hypothetical protein
LLGQLIGDELWSDTIEGCISDTFWVRVDEDILFSLTLTNSCEFFLIDYQSYEQINGEYSITDKVIKGSVCTIVFFINGEFIGEAIVAWPLEGDLCLIINDVVLRKRNKAKY